MRKDLVEDCPADLRIPAIWSAMQNHGLFDLGQFQKLCLRHPHVALSSYSNTYSVLSYLQKYEVLDDNGIQMFIKYPQILLRDAKEMERILIAMYRSMQCERKYIGRIIHKEPRILLAKVFTFIILL
jgi:hypothetical protein